MDTGRRVKASIKRKREPREKGGVSQTKRSQRRRIIRSPSSLDKIKRPEPFRLHRKKALLDMPGSSPCKLPYKPRPSVVRWSRPSLSSPRSINFIVWALSVRTQYYSEVTTNCVLTLTIQILTSILKNTYKRNIMHY